MTCLDELFLDAHELGSAAERNAFLDARCAGEPDLRGRIEVMLAAAAQADVFFGEAGDGGRNAGRAALKRFSGLEPESGKVIGHFKLLEQIGEGGFGVVWKAEQQEPVRREVALKIIKAGMDTREVVVRFEQERQALAMMDHPNIAQVFEAGSTERGRPYFVMELVRGVPVTRFCDEQCLPLRERLALFMEVCMAIQHAHRKGIIHRDIKPSNILGTMVDGKPVIKVIDFGIARAVQQSVTDKTLLTRFEQFMGTPAYMSPEQARGGRDIDTRSDIYSLGILLYELLIGSPPFDQKALRSSGDQEIRRMICEEEPDKPSSRIGAMAAEAKALLAQARRSEPARLRHYIKGDLDWIVMRALEKDRARRYDSANDLAADIRYFLADEPVSASPPGTAYILGKFARRHRVALGAAAAVMTALVAGLVASTWMFFQEKEARREAMRATGTAARRLAESEAARREANTLSSFLMTLLKSPYPPDKGPPITVKRVLDEATNQLPVMFKDLPENRALMEEALAMSYDTIGSSGMGLPLLARAADYVRRNPSYGAEHERSRRLQAKLALLYSHAGKHSEAVSRMEAALEWERRQDAESPMAMERMIDLAECYLAAGLLEKAKAGLVEVLPICRKQSGENSDDTLRCLIFLARIHFRLGEYQEALVAGGEGMKLAPENSIAGDDGLLEIMIRSQDALGNLAQAEELAERLRELREKSSGETNFYTRAAVLELGNIYFKRGRTDDAIRMWQSSVFDPVLGPQADEVKYKLGEALFKQERYQEALTAFNAIRRDTLSPDSMEELVRMVKISEEHQVKNAMGTPSPDHSPTAGSHDPR